MGYTHYWRRVKNLSDGWDEFIRDVKRVYENLPKYSKTAGRYYKNRVIKICGGFGEGEPIFNKDEVWFNGDAKRGLDHETFWLVRDIERKIKIYEHHFMDMGMNRKSARARAEEIISPENGYYFSCCKTARKPYDFFVCAVLILAKIHFGDKIKISSDGDISDWHPAIGFLQELGYKIPENLFS